MSVVNLNNEPELLRRISEGDEKAFRVLVQTYGPSIRAYVTLLTQSSELAEELVQDAFTQVWLARESLDRVRQVDNFLFIITRNLTFDALKKISRQQKRHRAWQQETTTTFNDLAPVEREAYLTLIEEAIEQLPPQQKTVWLMSRRENMTYHQIAAALNLSRETIKKYLQYATTSIKEYVWGRLDFWWLILFLKNFL